MVKTSFPAGNALSFRNVAKQCIEFFGKKTLTLRSFSNTFDQFGRKSAQSTTDTVFTGDLQFGKFLDEQMIQSGIIEAGDAVLYIAFDAAVTPKEQNVIIDGDATSSGTYDAWMVIEEIEAPEVNGTRIFRSYRCKRRDQIVIS